MVLLIKICQYSFPSATLSFSQPTAGALDSRIQRDDEFSDSEDEGEGGRRDRTSHQKAPSAAKTNGKTNGAPAPSSSIAPPTQEELDELLEPGRRPRVRPAETIEGEPEGEDIVPVAGAEVQAETSADRRTIETEDVQMGGA